MTNEELQALHDRLPEIGQAAAPELVAERAELEERIGELLDTIRDAERELRPCTRLSKAMREELAQRTYLVACPHPGCRAEPDRACRNLRTGEPKRWPHDERYAAYAAGAGVDGPLGIESYLLY